MRNIIQGLVWVLPTSRLFHSLAICLTYLKWRDTFEATHLNIMSVCALLPKQEVPSIGTDWSSELLRMFRESSSFCLHQYLSAFCFLIPEMSHFCTNFFRTVFPYQSIGNLLLIFLASTPFFYLLLYWSSVLGRDPKTHSFKYPSLSLRT